MASAPDKEGDKGAAGAEEDQPSGCLIACRDRVVNAVRHLLVSYHRRRASKEADMLFYAVTLDYRRHDLPIADLFSGMLCKEQVKWQSILLVFAVYNMFYIPFAISVSRGEWPDGEESKAVLEVIEKFGDIVFVFEVFFNFYLPYEEEGVQINHHSLIRRKYIRGWLTLDVIGAIPLELPWLVLHGDTHTTRLLRLNKLVRFFRLNFYWGRMEKNLLELNPSLIRLGKFLFLFFLAAHWVGCLWLEMVRLGSELDRQRWVGLDDFGDSSVWGVWDRYSQAIYWALVTMVGYGGTTPQTALQSFFSFAVVCVGVVMYVVVIGTVGTIVLNLDTAENMHLQKMENLNEFFRLKRLPWELANKVRTYHDFMWRSRQSIDQVSAISDLPTYLRIEIASHVCAGLLQKVAFFQNVNDHFLRQLSIILRPLICIPDTEVMSIGEMGKEMYFVSKGILAVFVSRQLSTGRSAERELCLLRQGHHFGEIALLCKCKRTVTVRSKEFCDLLVLRTDDFLQLLSENVHIVDEMRTLALQQYPTLRGQLFPTFGEDEEAEELEEDEEDEELVDDEENATGKAPGAAALNESPADGDAPPATRTISSNSEAAPVPAATPQGTGTETGG